MLSELGEAWGRFVAQLEGLGFAPGWFAGPATSGQLEVATRRFGRELRPELQDLYRVANGTVPSADVQVFPEVSFPSVEDAVEIAAGLREVAAEPAMPEGLWSEGWFPVFQLWADHVVAVDNDTGVVWFVSWEETRIHPVASSLTAFLDQWTELVGESKARFDADRAEWVVPAGFSGDTVPAKPLEGPDSADIAGLPHPLAYPPAPPAGVSVSEAFAELLEVHRGLGSTIPELLRPPAAADTLAQARESLGFDLHQDALELFGIADGIDDSQFLRKPEILPTLAFPGVAGSVEAQRPFDETSRDFVDRRRWWGEAWLPVFTFGYLTAITLDCRSGHVWSVYWSPGQTRQPSDPLDVRLVAPDLASYLVQATRILRGAPVTFVAETGRLDYYKGTGPSFV